MVCESDSDQVPQSSSLSPRRFSKIYSNPSASVVEGSAASLTRSQRSLHVTGGGKGGVKALICDFQTRLEYKVMKTVGSAVRKTMGGTGRIPHIRRSLVETY